MLFMDVRRRSKSGRGLVCVTVVLLCLGFLGTDDNNIGFFGTDGNNDGAQYSQNHVLSFTDGAGDSATECGIKQVMECHSDCEDTFHLCAKHATTSEMNKECLSLKIKCDGICWLFGFFTSLAVIWSASCGRKLGYLPVMRFERRTTASPKDRNNYVFLHCTLLSLFC